MSNDNLMKLGILTGLAEMFGRTLSDNVITMYLEALNDLTPQEFAAAAKRCIRECKFMPSVSDLRERCGKSQPSREDKALRAWSEAWDAVSTHGAYRTIMFSDQTTARTIQTMGGWPAFCRPEQEEQWHRKQFLETYRALSDDVTDEAPVKLIGLHERTGSAQPVVMIGTMPDTKRLETRERSDAQVMSELKRRAGTQP